MTDPTTSPASPHEHAPRQGPAHRGRRIAAAVSAGAFVGIGVGLVAVHAGDDADEVPTTPIVATDGSTGTDQFGGGFDAPDDDQFSAPTDQFGGATPSPFGGQGAPTAPDTNSGGS